MLKGLRDVLTQDRHTSGNYSQQTKGSVTEVYYHSTVICAYDKERKIFFADNRGFNTSSTNRAVHDCKYWCSGQYKEVTVDEFKEQTGAECHVGGWENGRYW